MDNLQPNPPNRARETALPSQKPPRPPGSGGGAKAVFDKIFAFFNNKWTRLGFSLVSAGYVAFLVWVAWLTFAYHFVYDNAVALFFLYSFVNAMFAVTMIYTRRTILTKIAVMLMHPIIIFMLIYGFGDWYLLAPPFIAATIIFFASGANESLKVILGTIYMILFVLAALTYITLTQLTIPIPGKMDLSIRESPEIRMAYNIGNTDYNSPPFRLVAYVDTERQNPTVSFFVERTDLDRSMWNLTAQRVHGSVRIGTTSYIRTVCANLDEDDRCTSANHPEGCRTIVWKSPGAIEWRAPNELWFDGRLIEIDEDGQIAAGDVRLDESEPTATSRPEITVPPFTTNSEPAA
jgi:hypothetical protein